MPTRQEDDLEQPPCRTPRYGGGFVPRWRFRVVETAVTGIGRLVEAAGRGPTPLDVLEHPFDPVVVGELVGHWWNGKWGSIARRDIRLEYAERSWLLEAKEGDRVIGRWLYDSEERARADVQQLVDTDEMKAEWREITAAFRASEDAARRRREG